MATFEPPHCELEQARWITGIPGALELRERPARIPVFKEAIRVFDRCHFRMDASRIAPTQ